MDIGDIIFSLRYRDIDLVYFSNSTVLCHIMSSITNQILCTSEILQTNDLDFRNNVQRRCPPINIWHVHFPFPVIFI